MIKSKLEKELKPWLSGAERVVIVGIGNPIRMDDYVGIKIVQHLQGKVSEKVYLIECETVPESYIHKIVNFNPTHILIIDAALLNAKPGEARLFRPDVLENFPAFSTHILPLRVFCDYLASTTGAKIALLLIQPKKTDFGEGLSPELGASAEKISKILFTALSQVL